MTSQKAVAPKAFALALALTALVGVSSVQAGQQNGAALDTLPFTLGPSDEIEVWVWQEPELTKTVTVLPDGTISLPLVGVVAVGGRTLDEVTEEVRQRLATYISEPIVNIIPVTINAPMVSVLGEVARANRFPLQQRLTVLDAIALAGGFTQYADRDDVVVVRPDASVASGFRHIEVNLKRLVENGEEQLLVLWPGDTVYVK